jgi:hypothetical protein
MEWIGDLAACSLQQLMTRRHRCFNRLAGYSEIKILVIKDYLSRKDAGQAKEKQAMGIKNEMVLSIQQPTIRFARGTFKQCVCVLSASVSALIMRLALESGQYIPLMNNHASGPSREFLPG